MAKSTITVQVSFAWWVRPYLSGVSLMAMLTGLEPDMGKVMAFVKKGMKTKVKAARP